MRKIEHEANWGIAKYYSDKGMISLINLVKSFDSNYLQKIYEKYPYEIYCLDGNLLEDVERFSSIELAEKRIKELLDNPSISDLVKNSIKFIHK